MPQRARSVRFTLSWLAAAVLLLPLSFLIWVPAASIIVGPGLLVSVSVPSEATSAALAHVLLATFAAAMGWCIGSLQLLVTRRYLHFELLRWREFSLLGGFAAGVVSSLVCTEYCVFDDINLLWVQPSLRPADGLLLSLLLFLGLLSVVQFLTLRRQARSAALWVIAHIVSVPLVYGLWRNPLATVFPRMESGVGIILITPLVAALVTAAVMLRIVSLSAVGDKAKRKARSKSE